MVFEENENKNRRFFRDIGEFLRLSRNANLSLYWSDRRHRSPSCGPEVPPEVTMPHARSACETLQDFVELHYPQLQILGVPEKYWPTLFNKLKNEVSTEAGGNGTTEQTLGFPVLRHLGGLREAVCLS